MRKPSSLAWCALGIIPVAALLALLLWPGPFFIRARFALHGLCAQNVLHSWWFGGLPLPYDGRENGMYLGAAVTFAYLWWRGRLFHGAVPPRLVITLLAIGPIAEAADGLNSLTTDLGLWHPWVSTNISRLLTGYGTGLAVGAALCWLWSMSTYHLARNDVGVRSWRDVLWLWLPAAPILAIHAAGWAWLNVPISLALITISWGVLTMLITAMTLLAARWDESIVRHRQLIRPILAGEAGALVVMISLAIFRIWLERQMGVPPSL